VGAQSVRLDIHTANGTDTSYFGIPLVVDFRLDASSTDWLEAIWIPLELQFTNGNILGPFGPNGFPQIVWLPASDVFESRGVHFEEATDPDSLTIYPFSFAGTNFTGAAVICRMDVEPLDTGSIDFTTTFMPTQGEMFAWCQVGAYNGEVAVDFNAPRIVVEPCPAAMMGDANNDGAITSADIIYLVIYVFRSGPEPLPVRLAGDADCNRRITSADIVYLAAYIFRSGPVPCPCTYTGG